MIHDILQWGGPAALLIIILITAVGALWRYSNQLQTKIQDMQARTLTTTQETLAAMERSTNVLNSLARTEEMRGQEIGKAIKDIVTELDRVERQLDIVLPDTLRVLLMAASNELKTVNSGIIGELREAINQQRAWQDTARSLTADLMKEIRNNKDLLQYRNKS